VSEVPPLEFVLCPNGHFMLVDFGSPGPFRCRGCRWQLERIAHPEPEGRGRDPEAGGRLDSANGSSAT
jgi:hypothetical protein